MPIRKTELFVAFLPKPYIAADLTELLYRSVGLEEYVQREKLEAGGPS